MTKPVTLITPAKKRNDEALKLARELVERVEAGEFESVIIMAFRPDGEWCELMSPMVEVMRKIGVLTTIIDSLVRAAKDLDDAE